MLQKSRDFEIPFKPRVLGSSPRGLIFRSGRPVFFTREDTGFFIGDRAAVNRREEKAGQIPIYLGLGSLGPLSAVLICWTGFYQALHALYYPTDFSSSFAGKTTYRVDDLLAQIESSGLVEIFDKGHHDVDHPFLFGVKQNTKHANDSQSMSLRNAAPFVLIK